MKRFLMLVGVAAVAGAMFVAAALGSQRSKGPTAKQFSALKKQVASLSKSLKTAKTEANAAAGFIATCLVSTNAGVLPVSQYGTSTEGFLFGDGTGPGTPRTALDVYSSQASHNTTVPLAYLQAVDPSCASTTTALRHGAMRSRSSRLHFRAERVR